VDLAANAASLGMDVLRAKTVRELRNALAEARASSRPTCVYVETDPAPTAPPAEAWWDVPVAEVSARDAAVRARARYDSEVAGRRRHL
jgi:3D-(3,5/4)-trihydroxycyclohexane-1,2-dione acylhydrolase (decyclizing)